MKSKNRVLLGLATGIVAIAALTGISIELSVARLSNVDHRLALSQEQLERLLTVSSALGACRLEAMSPRSSGAPATSSLGAWCTHAARTWAALRIEMVESIETDGDDVHAEIERNEVPVLHRLRESIDRELPMLIADSSRPGGRAALPSPEMMAERRSAERMLHRLIAGERGEVEEGRTEAAEVTGRMRVIGFVVPVLSVASVLLLLYVMRRVVAAADARKREAELIARQLAREAGKAEVASGVLHNVGNALNSVNVSASMIREQIAGTKAPRLRQAVDELSRRDVALGGALGADDKGNKLLAYLGGLADRWTEETEALRAHASHLDGTLGHIKVVVAKQQAHAKIASLVEACTPRELVQTALDLVDASLQNHGIRVTEHHASDVAVLVDKHRVVQVLTNLITNAKHALASASPRHEHLIELSSAIDADGQLTLVVRDNGEGISPEHKARMFQYGFTTKTSGHGFGLHNGALLAEELGGKLSCESAGRGQGATFTLRLPIQRPAASGHSVSSSSSSLRSASARMHAVSTTLAPITEA